MLSGDCSMLSGDCSMLSGYCSGLSGSLNEITPRPANIKDYINEEAVKKD